MTSRREFLCGSAAIAALALPGSSLQSEPTKVEYRWTTEAWAEVIAGQKVDFAADYDICTNSIKVRSYWRSDEIPRRAYAFGFRANIEDFYQSGYKSPVDFLRNHEKTRTLRECMGNTIAHVHGYAPYKPEGQAYVELSGDD
jgi:hypothetical protein